MQQVRSIVCSDVTIALSQKCVVWFLRVGLVGLELIQVGNH